MEDFGRWLAAGGFVIVALGAIVWVLGRVGVGESSAANLAREVQHVRPYVLFGSSLLLSIVLSSTMLLMQWFGRR